MTVLYGGSFDPVHNGHINAVRSVINELSPDRMIIMPAYVSPFKADKSINVSVSDRLRMCELAFGSFPCCEISDYEIQKADISYTVDTIRFLREKYMDERLILAIGSDSLRSLKHWRRCEEIFATADIAAVSRIEGEDLTEDAAAIERAGGRVTIVHTKPFEISSTELRGMIAAGEDVSGFLPDSVLYYIKEKSLYGIDRSR